MLVVTGIFDKERFIPDTPVSIPQKKRVVVTIEEETVEETKASVYGCLRQYADPAKYTQTELEDGYRAMAVDEEYEREAMEWCNGLLNGIDDETR